jgi:hypothetical protein
MALVLLILILFAPVRYRLYLEKHEAILVKVKATWLGFVICFKADYNKEDGFVYRLKSFGGTLVTNSGDAGINEEDVGDNDNENSAPEESFRKRKKSKESKEEEIPKTRSDISEALEDKEDAEFVINPDIEIREETLKTSLFVRIGKLLDKTLIKIKNKISAILLKIRKMKKRVDSYKRFISSRNTKEAVKTVKEHLINILKSISPRVIKGKVTYGTGDPASTGQHLGYMSIGFPLYYDKIDITPDFNQKICEGEIFIRGRITVITFLANAVGVLLNKSVRKTINQFKRISGGDK